jgi:hypothetical protein
LFEQRKSFTYTLGFERDFDGHPGFRAALSDVNPGVAQRRGETAEVFAEARRTTRPAWRPASVEIDGFIDAGVERRHEAFKDAIAFDQAPDGDGDEIEVGDQFPGRSSIPS